MTIDREEFEERWHDLAWDEAVKAMSALVVSMRHNRDKIHQDAYELLYNNWLLENPEIHRSNVPRERMTKLLDYLWSRFIKTFGETFIDDKEIEKEMNR